MTNGSLPEGLTLEASSGVISGTPAAAGTSTFTVQVSSGGQTASKAFSLTVNHPPVSITTTSPLPDGTRGVPYADTLRATGGDGTSYDWSVANGTPPAGLTLSAEGRLSGTPTTEGTSTFTVRAGSGGQMVEKTFDLKVNPPKQFPLQVIIVGAGTVTSDPSGISCAPICMALFDGGTVVSLTATGAPGWQFVRWDVVGGDCGVVIAIFPPPPYCRVRMAGPVSVTATFTQLSYELKVGVSGQGTVTSSPAGINAPSDSTETYPSGTVVTLTPTPAAGSVFADWSGSGCSGTGTCQITMNQATSVTATFVLAPRYKIAFWGRRHYTGLEITDWEIYVMNSDGSEQTRLTDTDGDNWGHRWSPDGSKIAFSSRRDGDWEIYVMNADGSGQTNLSQNHTYAVGGRVGADADEFPAWSPDGSRIAFTSTRDGGHQIYVMKADGSDQTNLSNAPYEDSKPAWSPDGTLIAFYSFMGGNMELVLMKADGSNQVQLTNTPEDEEDEAPKWAPDGGAILFARGRVPDREIIVRYPQGEKNLSSNAADDAYPVWSPDGTKIAFASTRDGNWEIYTMNADGSEVTRLTHAEYEDLSPSWSPDGEWIAFMSNRQSFPHFEIYRMRADGSDQIRLTHDQGDENEPRWSPVSR